MLQVEWLPYTTASNKYSQQVGVGGSPIKYNMGQICNLENALEKNSIGTLKMTYMAY